MIIHNPYPIPTDEDDKASTRFQTYISVEDKLLLMSLRPIRGTSQAVINHLIKNLCNELRELKLNFYRPDADDILAILVERRPLTNSQIDRLRCTTIGDSKDVPKGFRQPRRSSGLHQGASNAQAQPTNTTGESTKRVRRNSKITPFEPNPAETGSET